LSHHDRQRDNDDVTVSNNVNKPTLFYCMTYILLILFSPSCF